MRILIVNNPRSGLHDGAVFTFIRHLSEAGDEVVLRILAEDVPVAELVADAADFDLVVISGGDGTISAACYALRYSGVPVLPFPAGTGNLLFTNLELPDEPIALAKLARQPYLLEFDLGELTYGADGVEQTRGFAVAAGAGFDADIMSAAAGLKSTFGPGAYALAAISRANPTYSRFTLELDGEVLETEGIAVLLLNFAKIGPGLSITHHNDARDGLLEVTVLKQHNAIELLPALFAAMLDRDGGFPWRSDAVETHLASSARISADPPLLMQSDGDTLAGETPMQASVQPAAARLVVTEQAYRKFGGEGAS